MRIDNNPIPARLARGLCLPLLLVAATSHAIQPAQETHKLVRANEAVSALGTDAFGEEISLYTGSVAFRAIDVELPGNDDLPFGIGRRYTIEGAGAFGGGASRYGGGLFGDWDIDLPVIHGTFAANFEYHPNRGFTVLGANRYARCSGFAEPPAEGGIGGNGSFEAHEYWHGTNLYVPGSGDQEILKRSPQNTLAPGGNLAAYPLVTREHWQISCLPTLANAGPDAKLGTLQGEGFLARSPSGFTYRFDWLLYRDAELVSKPGGYGPKVVAPNPTALLPRTQALLYPTQITDRFGNTVTLTWSGSKLLSMSASDGRSVTLTYDALSRVQAVREGTRTWSYAYDAAGKLQTVTRPDGSAWSYALGGLATRIEYSGDGGCADPGTVANPGETSGTITHPSGAVATFTIAPRRHGRSWAGWGCDATYPVPFDPITFDTLSITKKTIAGAGVVNGLGTPGLTWNYTYGSDNRCWTGANAPAPVCTASSPTYKTVQVIDPEGDVTQLTFGNRATGTDAERNEGKLLKREQGLGTPSMRTDVTTYHTPVGPNPVGISLQERGDTFSTTHIVPEKRKTATLDGRSFVWEAASWDAYGNPTAVAKSSAGYSKNETITYAPSTTAWVLGLTDQVRDVGTNTVELDVDYDANGLPITRRQFGRVDQTMTYCNAVSTSCAAKGLLLTVADGAGKTTTFTSYKRGIPQSVRFADARTITGTVNDQGWVTSYTNEIAATTTYSYDALGRLTGIVQPSGDTTAWSPTSISFTKVGFPENGLVANHWKQSITTGRYRKDTLFDALLRPLVTHEWDSTLGSDRYTVRRFDSEGREIFASYPVGAVADYKLVGNGARKTYDAVGRLVRSEADSELGVLATSIRYLAGYRKQVTSPRGQVTTIDFMHYDEPTEDLPVAISAPEFASTAIARDVWGKPRSITRSGSGASATRNYVYDAHQRLCKLIEPERGAEVFHYDAANQVDWSAEGLSFYSLTACDDTRVPFANRISRSYDARDRLTYIDYPDATLDEIRTYRADGALASIRRGDSGTNDIKRSYLYNKRGMVTSETIDIDTGVAGGASTMGWSYDNLGHVRGHSYLNGLWVAYEPNALGQPTIVHAPEMSQTFANAISWYPNGALKGFTYGNGVVHTLTKNARDLPLRSVDRKGTSAAIVDYTNTYDANGNPTVIDDGLNLDDKSMTYDALDRLKAASGTFGTATMTYDGVDNLTRYRIDARDYRYVIGTDQRLVSITNAFGGEIFGFSHDVRGNTLQKAQASTTSSFTFDLANRLTTTSRDGALVATYRYDGHGRRTKTTKANGDQRFQVYSQAGQLLWDGDFASSVGLETQTNHIHLAGSLIAKVVNENQLAMAMQGSAKSAGADFEPFRNVFASGEAAAKAVTTKIVYVHTDALGSPVAETNEFGQVIAGSRTIYEPYGNPLTYPKDGAPSYTGHQFDTSTGLVYAQQRYYDPQIGRFLSVDPMAADSSTAWNFNRYAYAGNSPYKFTDPDGRVIKVLGSTEDKEFIDKTYAALAEIMKTPSGAAALEELDKSSKVHFIAPSKKDNGTLVTGDNAKNAGTPGVGSGSIIAFDADSKRGGKDENGSRKRPAFVGLAHELGHALDADRGEYHDEASKEVPGTTPPSEETSMDLENKVRGERNLPLRPSYYD